MQTCTLDATYALGPSAAVTIKEGAVWGRRRDHVRAPGCGELASFRAWLHKTPALHCRMRDIVTLKKWDVCIFYVLFREWKKEKKSPVWFLVPWHSCCCKIGFVFLYVILQFWKKGTNINSKGKNAIMSTNIYFYLLSVVSTCFCLKTNTWIYINIYEINMKIYIIISFQGHHVIFF